MNLVYTNKDELLKILQENKNEDIFLFFDENLSVSELVEKVKEVVINKDENKNHIFLRLKNFSYEHKKAILDFAIHYDDLNDIVLMLNVINLIKCYNDLEDSYFADENVLVSSIDELLDLSIDLSESISYLKKKVSIAFMSIFKSYHKFEFADTDTHVALSCMLKNIFLSCDLLTLSSIFGTSDKFSTDELYYVDNALFFVQELMMKNAIFKDLSVEILKGTEYDNSEG